MKVTALGNLPATSITPGRDASRKLEVVGAIVGGATSVTGLLFLAKGRNAEGYALLAATAIVGSLLAAVRLASD